MKKILSLITVFVMMFSLSLISVNAASGYPTDNYEVTLKAEVTMVKLGKAAITFTLSTVADDFENGSNTWDNDFESYVDGSIKGFMMGGITYVPSSTVFTDGGSSVSKEILTTVTNPKDITSGTTFSVKGTHTLAEAYKDYTAEQLNKMDIVEVKLVTAEIVAFTTSESNNKATMTKDTMYRTDGNGDHNIIVIVPKASGSTDVVIKDETFETEGFTSSDVTSGNVVVGDKNIEMGTNGKVYTYFKKTTKALTAGEYGITATINGKTYKFPGKANVGENGKWAIKLVVPNGTFSDNTSVGTITNATPYGID